MKTTVDIPEKTLKDTMHFAKASTKREAIVTAMDEFNRRHRLEELANKLGSSEGFYTEAELAKLRDLK